jgi:ABC-2 type transport system permease protein
MSVAVSAMRALALGGPVMTPILQTLAWSLGMVVIFLYPAIRGYKKASASG